MRKFFALICLTGVIASCQNDIIENNIAREDKKILLSEDEAISIANDNPQNLSEEDILSIVKSFSNSLNIETRSSCKPELSITGMYHIGGVKSSTRSAISDSIPIYKVGLKSVDVDGYALVSADSRSAGVLAYIENGNFEKRNRTGAGLMLKLAEATTIAEINKVERLKAELRGKTLNKIASSLGKTTITYDEVKDLIEIEGLKGNDIISRSPAYDKPLSQVVGAMPKGGFLLNVEWSQNSPYNLLLPKSYHPLFHMETHYPMGCAVTAGIQALTAIKPNMNIDGVTIDWNILTKNPIINYNPDYGGGDYDAAMMASRLSKHMYEGTGTKPNIDENFEYGPYDDPNIPCVKSSSTSTSALRDYLNKYVSCGTYYDKYAPDPLLNTINANRQTPCVAIMGGTHAANEQAEKGSHAWVIDGYLICVKTSKEILKKNDLYFHANMGWGGPDNGFYKVNADTSTDFETELGNYNANFWEITEIRRK
ncbi:MULTISPECIES: C10 family peptidase [Bacteroidales]|jgi:hypothetical protein|nr:MULTISPECIES: C10 family peptidase [Bacteroidales]MBV4387339.1 C10 family peptidase [Parabacteroides distasonis]MCB6322749.1 C10 family peptidase [Bacteroides thetaiotaomicron]MCB7242412.1 C10 family peptidase [Bacteroides thetaiotaomicron]MCB7264373.1 C10 family peptidase [Bacteroides uniformis]MCB7395003.1 C10 family peptidase [Bacteroides thetaiotaomicron]